MRKDVYTPRTSGLFLTHGPFLHTVRNQKLMELWDSYVLPGLVATYRGSAPGAGKTAPSQVDAETVKEAVQWCACPVGEEWGCCLVSEAFPFH